MVFKSMLGGEGIWARLVPTFDSPKAAKARLPFPAYLQVFGCGYEFFVEAGDILDDRLVTF